jgi:hypothetical protein
MRTGGERWKREAEQEKKKKKGGRRGRGKKKGGRSVGTREEEN